MTTAATSAMRQVPNRDIEDIWQALAALGRLRLDELENVKRVVTLQRRYFDKPRKIYQDLRNTVIEEHPVPSSWESSESLPVAVNEARQASLNQLADQTQEIAEIPTHLLLTDKDLPRKIKGELGDQNQFGLGDILHKLHFVYVGWGDETDDGTREET